MTLEELIRIASMCAQRKDGGCSNKECPLYRREDCKRHLLGCAVTYLSMYREGIPLDASAPAGGVAPLKDLALDNPGNTLIGEIMNHYKKPFVTIEINISEDGA